MSSRCRHVVAAVAAVAAGKCSVGMPYATASATGVHCAAQMGKSNDMLSQRSRNTNNMLSPKHSRIPVSRNARRSTESINSSTSDGSRKSFSSEDGRTLRSRIPVRTRSTDSVCTSSTSDLATRQSSAEAKTRVRSNAPLHFKRGALQNTKMNGQQRKTGRHKAGEAAQCGPGRREGRARRDVVVNTQNQQVTYTQKGNEDYMLVKREDLTQEEQALKRVGCAVRNCPDILVELLFEQLDDKLPKKETMKAELLRILPSVYVWLHKDSEYRRGRRIAPTDLKFKWPDREPCVFKIHNHHVKQMAREETVDLLCSRLKKLSASKDFYGDATDILGEVALSLIRGVPHEKMGELYYESSQGMRSDDRLLTLIVSMFVRECPEVISTAKHVLYSKEPKMRGELEIKMHEMLKNYTEAYELLKNKLYGYNEEEIRLMTYGMYEVQDLEQWMEEQNKKFLDSDFEWKSLKGYLDAFDMLRMRRESLLTPQIAVTSKTAVTPAPETAVTPAPETAVTPAPETAVTPAPETAVTPAPEIVVTPAPETAVTPAPETAVSAAPETAVTSAPETAV